MDAKQLYSPKGRINRAPYWIGFIILNSVFGLLERSPNPGVIVLWTVAFYVSCCLVIGRLHDLDRTGWWAAAFFGAVGFIVLVGNTPELTSRTETIVVFYAAIAALLVAGIYLGFTRGTDGPNRFGADPLVRSIPA